MNVLGRWLVKRWVKKGDKFMSKLLGKLIGLDFDWLIGIRTKLGILGLVVPQFVDIFTSDAFCTGFPKTCAIIKAFATWLTAAGLYGKR